MKSHKLFVYSEDPTTKIIDESSDYGGTVKTTSKVYHGILKRELLSYTFSQQTDNPDAPLQLETPFPFCPSYAHKPWPYITKLPTHPGDKEEIKRTP